MGENRHTFLVQELKRISYKYGLIRSFFQFRGGNISVKHKNLMLIKSSGSNVSDIFINDLYSEVNLDYLLEKEFLDELRLIEATKLSTQNSVFPSLETFMHANLEDYVVHFHVPELLGFELRFHNSIKTNKTLNSNILEFVIPGLQLGNNIKLIKGMTYNNRPNFFILKNHGVVISSNSSLEIDRLVYLLVDFLSKLGNLYLTKMLDNSICFTETMFNKNVFFYPSVLNYIEKKEAVIFKLKTNLNITPDLIVFFNNNIFTDVYNTYSALNHNNKGSILIFNEIIYIASKEFKYVKELDELLVFFYIAQISGGNIKSIDSSQVNFLLNKSKLEIERIMQI